MTCPMRNAFQCFAGTKRNSGYSKKKVYAIPLMPDERLSVCAGSQLERVLINAQMSGFGGSGNLVLDRRTAGFDPQETCEALDCCCAK